MKSNVRDVVVGEPITAALTNQGNPILRSVRTICGSDGVQVFQSEENGTTIGLDLPPRSVDSFIVQLTNKGPNNEADYTDCRYWGQLTYIKGAKPSDPIQISKDTPPKFGDSPGSQTYVRPPVITCTNLCEQWNANGSPTGSHLLKVDGTLPVRVWAVYDRGDPVRSKHYVFERSVNPVPVKITGSASGGGKYNGKVWTDYSNTTDISSSSGLVESDLGTQGQTCLILNTREVGKTTHDLASSSFLPLIFLGRLIHIQNDGTPVVAIDGYQWEDCS